MYIRNYPEDSVLHRHYESAAAMARSEWLQQPPTDSVLRRHYEQLRQAGLAAATVRSAGTVVRPAVAGTASATASARAAPPPERPLVAPPATAPAPARRGGVFGWLGRLFGG
jgi:hypothetical protein